MSELDDVLSLLVPETDRMETGRKRQAAVWEGKDPDYVPIILPGMPVQERNGHPRFNLKEQFYDPEKMLIEHLWELIGQARSAGDGQLCLRANLGVGFLATVFGLEEVVFEDKMPWLNGHLSKQQLFALTVEDFTPEKVRGSGLMTRALEYVAFFRYKLAGKAHVYLPDTQGPLDIAAQIYGHDIFIELYDDPEFVHHLLRLSAAAYISVSKVFKEAIGESLDSGYHRGGLYMSDGGVRCCEDTTTLVSPQVFREFVAPHMAFALRPFGGGWVHFCGSGHQWLEELLEIPEVKGVNFGNPERYDYEATMDLVLDRGKVYVGTFPRLPDESLQTYFQRILRPLKKRGTRRGLILILRAKDLSKEESPEGIVDLWHVLQDEAS